MGLLQRVVDAFRPATTSQPQNAGVTFSPELMEAYLRNSAASTSWETAIQVTAILACARIKANDLASAPWKIMKDNDDGSKVEAKDHPYFDMIRRTPNKWQTGFEFRQTIGLHLALAGNAYVWLDRRLSGRAAGQVIAMLPIDPGSVTVCRDKSDWTKLAYDVTFPDGTTMRVGSESIWHLRDLSWNSYKGLPALQYARESIGLTKDIERSQTDAHRSAAKPSGVLAVANTMSPEQFQLTRELVDMQVRERLSRGYPMVVDQTMTWTQLAAKATDLQSTEVKKQTFENIAIHMGILPAMIGYNGDGSQSYASVEHLFIRHNIQVRIPLFTSFEESADRWLLSAADYKAGYYNHLVDQAIMRGDIKTRGEYYKVMVNVGAMTPNEVRVLENRNRMNGLDQAYMQLNMAPLDEEGMHKIAEGADVDNNFKSADAFKELGSAFAKASPAAQHALISRLRDMAGEPTE